MSQQNYRIREMLFPFWGTIGLFLDFLLADQESTHSTRDLGWRENFQRSNTEFGTGQPELQGDSLLQDQKLCE